MKKIALALSLLAIAAMATADDYKAIARQHGKEFDQAMLKEDMTWFDRTATKDFFEIDGRGRKIGRKEALETMKQGFQMMAVKKSSSRVVSVKPTKDGFTAIVVSDMVADMPMPNQKKPSKWVSQFKAEENYVKVGSAYKMRSLKHLGMKSILDGKPFDPMAGGK